MNTGHLLFIIWNFQQIKARGAQSIRANVATVVSLESTNLTASQGEAVVGTLNLPLMATVDAFILKVLVGFSISAKSYFWKHDFAMCCLGRRLNSSSFHKLVLHW